MPLLSQTSHLLFFIWMYLLPLTLKSSGLTQKFYNYIICWEGCSFEVLGPEQKYEDLFNSVAYNDRSTNKQLLSKSLPNNSLKWRWGLPLLFVVQYYSEKAPSAEHPPNSNHNTSSTHLFPACFGVKGPQWLLWWASWAISVARHCCQVTKEDTIIFFKLAYDTNDKNVA